MKKSISLAIKGALVLASLSISSAVFAGPSEGAEFKIVWDAKAGLYRVFMRPTTTPTPDATLSAQVTIRVPHAEPPDRFTVTDLVSKVSDISWSNSSKAYGPSENTTADYLSFTPTINKATAFAWQEGIEKEIFSFKNDGKCLGLVRIMDNDTDPFNVPDNSMSTNPGNELSNLGWQVSNAYAGIYGEAADCGVAAENTNPVAEAISVNTTDAQPVTIDVLAKATDADGDTLTISAYPTDTDFGTVKLQDGKLVYTSIEGYEGTETFNCTVTDGKGGSATAAITVVVTKKQAVNQSPTAGTVTVSTNANTPATIDVLAKASDPDGDTLTISSYDQITAHGSVALSGNQLVYTPAADFSGSDTINFTVSDGKGGTASSVVTVTVKAVNRAPAVSPIMVETVEQVAVSIDVLAKASDPDGDTLVISAFDQTTTQNGTVTLHSGVLTYTPSTGFSGSDSFTATVSDNKGGIAKATITITVVKKVAENQLPTVTASTATVQDGQSVTMDVLAKASDPDGDTLTISQFDTKTAHGTVTLVDNKLVYIPTAGFSGTDTINFKIADGKGGIASSTVTVTVTPKPNTAPTIANMTAQTVEDTAVTVDVLSKASDVDNDILAISAFDATTDHGKVTHSMGTLTYTPSAGYSGTDTIRFTIADGRGGTTDATITVTITKKVAENQAPVAADMNVTTAFNTPATIDILAKASDADGDGLTIATYDTTTSHGAVTLKDGKLVYTPAVGFSGTDTIRVTVADGKGGTDSATITVTVAAKGNTKPVVPANIEQTTLEETALSIDVLALATDADNDTLTITDFEKSLDFGSVKLENGKLVYTPIADFTGTEIFKYTISDGKESVQGQVTVVVQPKTANNTAPTAEKVTVSTTEGVAVTVDVLVVAKDPDAGDVLSIKTFDTKTEHGAISQEGRKLVYTPAAGFSGTETFSYTIADSQGATASSTVTVTVAAKANTKPTVTGLSVQTTTDTALTIDVLAKASDADGDTLTISAYDAKTAFGTAIVKDGKLVYTPNNGYVGTDSLNFTVSDGKGGTASATVTITVVAKTDGNNKPYAPDVTTTVDGSETVAIDVLSKATDSDGDKLSITAYDAKTANGTVQLKDGKLLYTPKPGFAGTDTFTYTISDIKGATTTASITVTVTAVVASGQQVAVPTLSQWAQLLMSLVLGLVAVFGIGRKHKS